MKRFGYLKMSFYSLLSFVVTVSVSFFTGFQKEQNTSDTLLTIDLPPSIAHASHSGSSSGGGNDSSGGGSSSGGSGSGCSASNGSGSIGGDGTISI